MINADRLTVKSAEALNEAIALARRAGNPLVYDLHLLSALLTQDEGIVVPILQKLGVNVTQLREQVDREMGRFPKQSGAQPSTAACRQPATWSSVTGLRNSPSTCCRNSA